MNDSKQTQNYRVPTAQACATVSLDAFDRSEIREYIAHMDQKRALEFGDEGIFIDVVDIYHIYLLVTSGHRSEASDLVLKMIGDAIGKTL